MNTPRRTLALIAAAGLTLLASSVPVSAAPPAPAGTTPTLSGWVTVRQPRSIAYTPAARDRGNSAGGVNVVVRQSTGHWRVTMPDLNASGGDVQVVSMSMRPRICYVDDWSGGGDLDIHVVCTDHFGEPTDTPFSVVFLEGTAGDGGSAGRLAYFYNSTAFSSGTPSLTFQYTSALTTIDVTRTGIGVYTAFVPGVSESGSGGNVQVSSRGEPSLCSIGGWNHPNPDLAISVRCYGLEGTLQDRHFDLVYSRKMGMEGFAGGPSAYLWADQPRAPRSMPNSIYTFNSARKGMTVSRLSKGTYLAKLRGMPTGGAAIVTSYGTKSRHCQLTSIRTSGTPQQVGVRCFTATGTPVDSRFTLSYTR